MTARNPLFEFMPYGAPELLDAERSHLLRALAAASSLALAAFLLAHALGLTFTPDRPIRIELPGPAVILDLPPAIQVQEPMRLPLATPAKIGRTGVIQPVPDQAAPPNQTVVSPGEGRSDGTGHGFAPPAPGSPAGPVIIGEDQLPDLKQYVYVEELPVPVKIVEPKYPELATEAGIDGRVYVHMLVGKDGHVLRVEVDPKFSVPILDESALAAARQWMFKPGFTNAHPVPVWVGQMFVFTLHH